MGGREGGREGAMSTRKKGGREEGGSVEYEEVVREGERGSQGRIDR